LLERYRDELCCFNDDIQGTAAVAVGTLLAACKAKQETIAQQTVTFVGAGSAGCGIAEQIIVAMMEEGLSEKDARARIFMVDRYGLLTTDMDGLYDFQSRLAHDPKDLASWPSLHLLDVVTQARPTILIGVSGQAGLFTQEVIEALHSGCDRPLVMPLSNPTSRVEAVPADILAWTNGQALVATGSPFAPVELNGEVYPIAQCNNAYIFPGIGLGIIAVGAKRVTDTMIMAASHALAKQAPMVLEGTGALLPSLSDIRTISRKIAFEVAIQAQADHVAPITDEATLWQAIDRHFWYPRYRSYRRRAV
ncbi:MAG: oxaloacetate-decarboxylating malate dehydrogenase, partial [Natronospirillum sp.]